jgi:hypothetical protein
MPIDRDELQEREWSALYQRIDDLLGRFGTKDAFRGGDYWIRDDNWGVHEHSVEIQNLALLDPVIVESLREVMVAFPDWEVVVSLDVPGTEDRWPRMGVVVLPDRIIDGLRRDYLPERFRTMFYRNSA